MEGLTGDPGGTDLVITGDLVVMVGLKVEDSGGRGLVDNVYLMGAEREDKVYFAVLVIEDLTASVFVTGIPDTLITSSLVTNISDPLTINTLATSTIVTSTIITTTTFLRAFSLDWALELYSHSSHIRTMHTHTMVIRITMILIRPLSSHMVTLKFRHHRKM
jgi:hypothetical protein